MDLNTSAFINYFSNPKRMELSLDKMGSEYNLGILPVRGMAIRTPKGIRTIGDTMEFIVATHGGSGRIFYTNNESFSKLDGKAHNIGDIKRENIYVQCLTLLAEKYKNSNNPFTLVCQMEGHTLKAEGLNGGVVYTAITPAGNVMTMPNKIPSDIYENCFGFKQFSYSVNTPSCQRDVSVRSGQMEILRDIAHYIGKSLVFTTLGKGDFLSETVINYTGCCVCHEKPNSNGVCVAIKVPFTKLTISTDSYVSAADYSLEAILRAGSVGNLTT